MPKLVDHPELIAALPVPTAAQPWRVLISGCMAGWGCGVDGTDYGMAAALEHFARLPNLHMIPFCPEDVGLGTPRTMPDIHAGDGFAVLDGRARVLDERGVDLTAGMLRGAEAMLAKAREAAVHFAILTDMSGACGSQVISLGCRFDTPRRFQRGVGVATAMLLRAGVAVVSQRDFATLGALRARLDPEFVPDPQAVDHHMHPWVRAHLPVGAPIDHE
jgi:uncharacterized protein YbbK (DUF523 family)